jgi:signal transduction histidine kinase
MLRRVLGEDHELDLALAPDAGEIRADRGQLEQVLVNLMLNARDAMAGRGRVTITTRVTVLEEDYADQHDGVGIPRGEYVQLAVSDTGVGMDRETQARIFEPFFTTKPVGQGTGLGLDIAFRIVVNKHRGYLKAVSEPGSTTFVVRLPLDGPKIGETT